MKISKLEEITQDDYRNAVNQLKKDEHHTDVITDFLFAIEQKKDFRLENLKLLARPNFEACITILIYKQIEFYKNKSI
ncbi:hypothetical protein CPU12_12350 [Malaciobacter molluscorum LMG 25693]|uniref:Uncharacterized protein n=1 Tax=Malaciobacter molluscorum LMG 25693 TaxID=870501 RepID=A0A2G1DFD1_9BACT|nr:hypothetical protein [Malaciobacter molluscorum]AXX93251.1 hypothetical protein AMOL_2299 [Malaciobacter molluscorum LMG 25693]PHO17036.1 hypothetical protein CPU12_12350 [Malaciobacter molluscorum LMG 25693]